MILISSLARRGWCNAGDKFLAQELDVSPRTVRRYIKILNKFHKINKTTFAFRQEGGWFSKRLIRPNDRVPVFGLTRHEIKNYKQSSYHDTSSTSQMSKTPKRLDTAIKIPPRRDVLGFGAADYTACGINVSSSAAETKTEIETAMMVERARQIAQKLLDDIRKPRVVSPEQEELDRLRKRYVKASLARARRGEGPVNDILSGRVVFSF